MAGVGFSVLPPRLFRPDIEGGRLRVLETAPPITPVPFFAALPVRQIQPLPQLIARLAGEVSTFEREE